jgi:hypothetical protein
MNRAAQSALLLLDAVAILTGEGLDQVVIRAFALAIYGAVPASRDVNVLLCMSFGRLKQRQPLKFVGREDSLP